MVRPFVRDADTGAPHGGGFRQQVAQPGTRISCKVSAFRLLRIETASMLRGVFTGENLGVAMLTACW